MVHLQSVESPHADPARWQVLAGALDGLEDALERADRAALHHSGEVPADLETEVRWRFRSFCLLLDEQLGADAPGSPQEKEAIGAKVRRVLFPYLLLARLAERMYSKPRGFAGDFLCIELLHGDAPAGHGRIGPLIDRCFLDQPAAVAVRNRRRLMARELREVGGGETARVTSLACGPAAELFDAYAAMPDPSRLRSTAIDVDAEALAFVGARREQLRLERWMTPVRANLVYVARGQQALPLEGQDLVYSIGLIDYFPDLLVVALLDWSFEILRPGGKVILGNFHPRNPSRALMDHVLEWRLTYRTEEDMHRLFRASRFGRPCTEIRFEAEGINLFAACIKP